MSSRILFISINYTKWYEVLDFTWRKTLLKYIGSQNHPLFINVILKKNMNFPYVWNIFLVCIQNYDLQELILLNILGRNLKHVELNSAYF